MYVYTGTVAYGAAVRINCGQFESVRFHYLTNRVKFQHERHTMNVKTVSNTTELPAATLRADHPRSLAYAAWDRNYGQDVRDLREQLRTGEISFAGFEF